MRLIFMSGPREGQSVEIDGSRLMFGRIEDNDVQLADSKVSRHHAVIELEDGRPVLRDLASRNGTYVDGVKLVEPRVLNGGEQLRIGDQQLRVEPAPAAGRRRSRRRLAGIPRRRLVVAGIAALVLTALVVGQLVLPGVGENSLRSDLGRYGPVRHVDIASLPAIKLLWHRADRVDVAMDSYRSESSGHGSLADFLSDTRNTGKLDARVGALDAQLVTLHDVRLRKDGDALVGQARLTQGDLSAALPAFVNVRPISASQNGIVVRALGSAFGKRARVRLRILADGGKVVVRPDGLPFGSLASISVFNDPRVYVESLGAKLRGDQYFLTARALLK